MHGVSCGVGRPVQNLEDCQNHVGTLHVAGPAVSTDQLRTKSRGCHGRYIAVSLQRHQRGVLWIETAFTRG